ncbi:MAG TPA: PadR family transcriptional regulator [Vicinamibacterales bacterium]|nr:PadR family transcriptional regulator [Vicinamibacterales bacterium]
MKGTVDLMILRTLELRPMHGAAIAQRIAQITGGTFEIKAGSLFPALHRLEQQGWITGEWTSSADSRRVKSYVLTASGRRQLNAEKASWNRVVTAMNQVLSSS